MQNEWQTLAKSRQVKNDTLSKRRETSKNNALHLNCYSALMTVVIGE